MTFENSDHKLATHKLSFSHIKKLPHEDKRYFVRDSNLEGLAVKVYANPSELKTFVVLVKRDGVRREKGLDKPISDYVDMTEVRDEAREKIKLLRQGIDIRAEKKKIKLQDISLQDAMDTYIKKAITRHNKKLATSTIDDIKRASRCGWYGWHDKSLRTITESMVKKRYIERAADAKSRAALEMKYFRQIWNWTKKTYKEINLPDHPVTVLNDDNKGWAKPKRKVRRLDNETAPTWYQALEVLNQRDRDFFLLIYYTGLRAGEAMNLTVQNIDFKKSSLHIPVTKNGKPLDIPLNNQAMNILEGRKDLKKYLFPVMDRNIPMKSYSSALRRLSKKDVNWSPHDARRGFISSGGYIGINEIMIRQLTNHVNEQDAHSGYHQYTIAELRPAAQKIGDWLEQQALGNVSNVVPIWNKA